MEGEGKIGRLCWVRLKGWDWDDEGWLIMP